MLRDAVLAVRGDVGEPHVLHRVVEVVGACPGGAEDLAPFPVALPQEAAARVGVCEGSAVEEGRGAEPVLVVVDRLLVGDDRVAVGQADRVAENRAVGGVALNDLVGGEFVVRGLRFVIRAVAARGAGERIAVERVGVDREDAVLVERFGDGVAHEQRRSVARGGVGDLVGVGVNGRDAHCPGAPGFLLDRGVAVAGQAGVARQGAGDEGCDAVRHDVARLGARTRRVVLVSRVAGQRLEVAHGHEGVGERGCVVQHVGDDVGELLRHGGAAALLDAQGLVAELVVVRVRPRAGVAPDEAGLTVAGGVRRVVPVVRPRPFPVPARGLGAVGLADDGVVALADAALLRADGPERAARQVVRGAGLGHDAVAPGGEVAGNRQARPDLGDVIEPHPVAVDVGEGLVRHDVVQSADLLEADMGRAAVDVHDLPRVLQRLRGGVVDRHPHAVLDVRDAEVAAARVAARDPPRAGLGRVGDGGVGVREELERGLGDVGRHVRREPHEPGDLPLHGRAERDAELQRTERGPLQ